MTEPTTTADLAIEINYGQVYIYSTAPWANDPQNNAAMRALDDARQSGRFVGTADGLVDLVTPVQSNFNAPMRLEIWPAEPASDDDDWDHVVDVDLDVTTGRLLFEGSGGRNPIICDVPTGTYRARLSGRGYTAAVVDRAEGMDSYRLRLWPRGEDRPPTLRKSWPGWRNIA